MNVRDFFVRMALFSFIIVGLAAKQEDHKMSKKVCIVGSGNWGTCVARRVALNILDLKDQAEKEELATEHKHASEMPTHFDEEVRMFVYEEMFEGRKLSEIINEQQENVKYLPGVKLPKEVVAVPDLLEACANADILMFVTPHQFLAGTLKQLKGHVKSDVIAVSLIKGLDVGTKGPVLLSSMIKSELSLTNDVVVVMGANVAAEVAEDQFVEITVACKDLTVAQTIVELLESPCFRSSICTDVITVEIFGALKNVIALGAGFCDALELGCSTKAAVMRRGLAEMMDFCKEIAGESYQPDTILQSAGVADVIATCFGGRNRRCAAEFGRKLLELESNPEGGSPVTSEMIQKWWSDIETTALKGQKMQGVLTAGELMECLQELGLDQSPQVGGSSTDQGRTESYAHYIHFNERRKMLTNKMGKRGAGVGSMSPGLRFGLFTRIHAISHLGASPLTLFDW